MEQRPGQVIELHASAPYFDEHAAALGELIERVAPRDSVHLYVGARPSVDGAALRGVLASAGPRVSLYRIEPERFVHAKLIGIVGEDEGLLACGSANLSHAALGRSYMTPGSGANCEAIVLRRGSADDVRAVFCPPGSELTEIELEEVTGFRYDSSEGPPCSWSVTLLSASVTLDRRLAIRTAAPVPGGVHLRADEHSAPWPLIAADGGAVTDPVADDIDPLVVSIVDELGRQVSNAVVVDDPSALEAMLGERSADRDRPTELADEDERSDLVALLAWAHQQFIFDLDDTPAVQRARHSAETEGADPVGFWEKYAREELSYDQRSQTYRPLGARGTTTGTDLLLREIEAMLHAAPHERRLRLVRGLAADSEHGPGGGQAWSFTARQRVRARNLIRRWARALPDPRHAWVAPEAPARNYEALIEVLALIWLGAALERGDIVELLSEVWTGLLGSATRKGLADRADPELRDLVLGDVRSDVRELAAGMAYCALVLQGWADFIYDWQPFLLRGLAHELFVPSELACAFVEAILAKEVDQQSLAAMLERRAHYVDDERWGKQTAADLKLTSVHLVPHAGFHNVSLVVAASGMVDPAHDPRTVVLARRAMSLKRSDHVLVQANGERYLLRIGEIARAKIGSALHHSVTPIDWARLEAVEQNGGTLADLIGIAAA